MLDPRIRRVSAYSLLPIPISNSIVRSQTLNGFYKLEHVKHKATNMVSKLCGERWKELGMFSLEMRWLKGHTIVNFKYLKG